MRAVDTGDRRSPPGRGRLAPILRDWLVETIPDQIADLRDVIAELEPDVIATDLSLWGSVAVLPELTTVPVALSSTFMGPLIPGPGRAGVRLRPASAARTGRHGRSHAPLTALTELAGAAAAPPARRDPRRLRPGAARRVGQPLHGAAAALPGRQRPRARLRPRRPAAQRPLRRQLHLVPGARSPTARPPRSGWRGSRPSGRGSTCRREHPRLRRPVPAAHGGARRWPTQPVEVIVTAGSHRDPAAPGFDVSAAEHPRRPVGRPRRAAAPLLGADHGRRQGDRARRARGGRADGRRADHLGQARQRPARHRGGRRRPPLGRAPARPRRCAPRSGGPRTTRATAPPPGGWPTRLAAAPGPAGAAELLERLAADVGRPRQRLDRCSATGAAR